MLIIKPIFFKCPYWERKKQVKLYERALININISECVKECSLDTKLDFDILQSMLFSLS